MNLHKFANHIFLEKSEQIFHRSAVTLVAQDFMSDLNKLFFLLQNTVNNFVNLIL